MAPTTRNGACSHSGPRAFYPSWLSLCLTLTACGSLCLTLTACGSGTSPSPVAGTWALESLGASPPPPPWSASISINALAGRVTFEDAFPNCKVILRELQMNRDETNGQWTANLGPKDVVKCESHGCTAEAASIKTTFGECPWAFQTAMKSPYILRLNDNEHLSVTHPMLKSIPLHYRRLSRLVD